MWPKYPRPVRFEAHADSLSTINRAPSGALRHFWGQA